MNNTSNIYKHIILDKFVCMSIVFSNLSILGILKTIHVLIGNQGVWRDGSVVNNIGFQRIWAPFPAPTRQFTTICIPSSKNSDALFWAYVGTVYTVTYVQAKHTYT